MSKPFAKLSLRSKTTIDFSNVGGLNEHIRTLREIIILPLIYADLYSFFSIKAPRGLLFYGPPGTGKTLVASALASELSKEGQGKVHFFHRKGADVMNKWVGEAERKLRELFEKASKHRPSLIFFDELDGLAPPRSQKDDQIHCSVVTTLLALMDSLNNTPGVIVIGATNRVDAIDSALRRPGRFDKELYFPMPCASARNEILQVFVQSWAHKPNSNFLTYLAEVTTGCTGADLQALCSEAFLCCVKRLYPNINNGNAHRKIVIDKYHLKVQECDFLSATKNITPWAQRMATKMRRLSYCIKPLLQRQLNWIHHQLQMIWPHFTTPGYKFIVDAERYIGRLLLIGTNRHGLTMHLLPALLQTLEHLPIKVVDANSIGEQFVRIENNIPSVLLLSRIHDWWNLVDEACIRAFMGLLEDIHPSSPLLIICTCDGNVPEILHNYFANNSSLVIHIENPTKAERKDFFRPLFFGNDILSVHKVLNDLHTRDVQTSIKKEGDRTKKRSTLRKLYKKNMSSSIRRKEKSKYHIEGNIYRRNSDILLEEKQNCVNIKHDAEMNLTAKSSTSMHCLYKTQRSVKFKKSNRKYIFNSKRLSAVLKDLDVLWASTNPKSQLKEHFLKKGNKNLIVCARHSEPNILHEPVNVVLRVRNKANNTIVNAETSITTALTNLVHVNLGEEKSKTGPENQKNVLNDEVINVEDEIMINSETATSSPVENQSKKFSFSNSLGVELGAINNLYERVVRITTKGSNVGQLELLYDTISACIYTNRDHFGNLLQKLEMILSNFEHNFS